MAAWTFYGLGCAAWWLECKFFGHFCSIYRIYNWLMITACEIQGPSGNGPWGPDPRGDESRSQSVRE